jgi:beta-phosphoglucomutase family hydrolase
MQAANEGAVAAGAPERDRSVGIRVALPFEQGVNPFVEQVYVHKTFFTRLHHFVLASDAFVVAPGGVGTLLEMTMIWQLLQVRHLHGTPLILVGDMWDGLVGWARVHLLNPTQPLANPNDLAIPRCVATADEAVALLREHHAQWQASAASQSAAPIPGTAAAPGRSARQPARATGVAGAMSPHSPITRDRFDAVLFDLDGVLTSTAKIHASCWKTMFDDFLARWARQRNEPARPFDIAADYKLHVDGKPRYDGVRSFLASRAISLPEGTPADSPTAETVCGLGNRKDELVKAAIARGEVESYPGSVALVRRLREQGIHTAVVSSSNNCEQVLQAAGILNLFDARVDGLTAGELQLPGKPAPDTFLKAAEMLGVPRSRAVVVEDAIAGVQAGRAGGFGLVVGVDRGGSGDALRTSGADVVVTDLAELLS